jgi:Bacterial TSP3 repeat
MKSLLHSIPWFVLCIAFVSAEPPGIDQSLELVTPFTGSKFIRWHGKPGRSYFVQVSDPANHLQIWHFATIIEDGNDEDTSYEVDGTADKGFFRLKYTNQVPGPGATLETADFDGDGISNWDEISLYHTDPLNPDTDGDGLPDGWEVAHNLNPNDSSDAASLFPGSNLSNLQAFNSGVQANPNATMDNFDGDDLANVDDADPNDATINWKKTADPQFAVIELPLEYSAGLGFDDLSPKGTVMFTSRRFHPLGR